MNRPSLKPLLVLLAVCSLAVLPGCIRRQEELAPAGATQAATEADFPDDVAFEEIAVEVAVPDRTNSLEIRCQVSARNGRAATIQWVVENGADVKKGDELVRFETDMLEKEISAVTMQSHIANAELVKAGAAGASAKLALTEFVEGTFPLEVQQIESEMLEAEIRQRAAADNKFEADLANVRVALARKKLSVLQKFTKPRRTEELKGAIAATQAELEARAGNLELLTRQRDRLIKQLESCVVKATENGQVFLADENGIRPGAIVRQRQVLIYLQERE